MNYFAARTAKVLGEASVVGVGETPYRSRTNVSAESLALDAACAAIADAGITPGEVDGLLAYAGHVPPESLISGLGLRQVRMRAVTATLGGASAVAALADAATAVITGRANNVLIYRAIRGRSGMRNNERHSPSGSLRAGLEAVHGWTSAAQRYAFLCHRYRHEYGLTPEQLGAYCLLARSYAQDNPKAQLRGKPVTMDDYLNSRLISEPFRLLDCCLESDGACAVVVSRSDGAQRQGVRILAVAEGHPDSPDDLTNRRQFLQIGLDRAAQQVWEAIGLSPNDMDAAMIYDCFTFEVIHQLESAGFVEEGKAAEFLGGGGGALSSSLPINTHGGLMAEGHMAGLNHVIEAVRQLRGECGIRQVTGATRVAVTGWGALGDGSLAVLTKE